MTQTCSKCDIIKSFSCFSKNKNSKSGYHRQRRNDPTFRLKLNISNSVRNVLKKSKNGKSTFKYLPYTIQELKQHLEKQFEPWMTWENWGVYNAKTWDDQSSASWTWQLDHIVPHNLFNYQSVEDETFKKCWALENLRPLSGKQNFLDGTRKIRHFKE